MPNIKINFTENVPPHIRHNAADAAAKRGKAISPFLSRRRVISPFLSRRRVQTRQDRTKREQSRENMP
ncbi:serine/arginine repetitive matrix 2 [Neisseria gonorrhoeae]|uniref:serine/arginine repetitive matrix 2 n=1 Tax=Neisseria gonorrhoeae TaxID=485 RepID=UPI00280448CD|nr:serine/arginine repetitive matrix 2 [Neisseria gonorrhoeae]